MSRGLQETIATLTQFWTAQGCLALPSCDLPVSAAFLNPSVFFRLLDAEPWSAAFLQPVRRPFDGRFARHPFRLARHLQFEVVIRDPRTDLRQLYLDSLAELGADLGLHDLRFAERDGAVLSIGARGLGWHVLMDGIGVTRFTFLTELAGRPLEPVAVEITYGLERLLMAIDRVGDAFSLPWRQGGPSLGDLTRGVEVEFSRYAMEAAEATALEEELSACEAATRRAFDAGLLRLAYENAVRMLQPIDLLRLRGALTARERHEWLERTQKWILAIAEAHREAGETAAAEETGDAVSGNAVTGNGVPEGTQAAGEEE